MRSPRGRDTFGVSTLVGVATSNSALVRIEIKGGEVLTRTISSPLTTLIHKAMFSRLTSTPPVALIPAGLDLRSVPLVAAYKPSSAQAAKKPAANPAPPTSAADPAKPGPNTDLNDWI